MTTEHITVQMEEHKNKSTCGQLYLHAIKRISTLPTWILTLYCGVIALRGVIMYIANIALSNLATTPGYDRVFVLTYIIGMPLFVLERKVLSCILLRLRRKLLHEEYSKYQDLSHVSKNEYSAMQFDNKYNDYEGAITRTTRWGVLSFIHMIINILSCVAVSFQFTHSLGVIAMLVTFVVSSALFMPRIAKAYKEAIKKATDVSNHTRNLWVNYAGKFQRSKISVTNVKDIKMESHLAFKKTENPNHLIFVFPSVFLDIVVLLAYFVFSAIGFIKFAPILMGTDFSICEFMFFCSEYTEMQTKYASYMGEWVGKTKNTNDVKKDLPNTLEILGCHIPKANIDFTGCISVRTQGEIILVKGKSGGGKSTFLNALLGKIDGMTLGSNYEPQELSTNFVEYYQSIKEDMPLDKITYSEFFGSKDAQGIADACHLCGFTQFNPSADLEAIIPKTLSGGEKDRIALATIVFEINNVPNDGKPRIVTLDEPGKEWDDETALEVISAVINHCCSKNMTMIMISHHSNVHSLPVWTQIFNITGGIITKLL